MTAGGVLVLGLVAWLLGAALVAALFGRLIRNADAQSRGASEPTDNLLERTF